MWQKKENSDLSRRRRTGFERSLEDFFVIAESEKFWCMFCQDYFEAKEEEDHPAGRLVMLTCGHMGLKWNLRNLTRAQKEKEKSA